MAKIFSYCPFIYALLWIFVFSATNAFSQDCGCLECPVAIEDLSISSATFRVDGAVNNSLSNNSVASVQLRFNHTFPSEIEMRLTSPAGQSVTLIGPQGTSSSAVFFGGFNVTFVTDINTTNPDPGMNTIWHNADLSGIQSYTGSYLPHSGSLLNYNTGTVNGDWILEITDPVLFDMGTLREFNILFVDQDGIDCCRANAGTLNASQLSACQGEETLLLDISPVFSNGAPSDLIYGYTYFITQNGIILELTDSPDLTNFDVGTYEVYGFSYDLTDESLLPNPNGTLTIANFASNIQGLNPLLCGSITSDFLEVVILSGATEEIVLDTICNGESVFLGGLEIFDEGVYRDTFPTLTSCDSVVQLHLLVGSLDTIELFDTSCAIELIGADTAFLMNQFGCDSIVITNTSLLPSDTIFVDIETCTFSQDQLMDTITVSTPECDSIIITSFFYEAPDTIFTALKTCMNDEVGLDTFLIDQGQPCEDVEIVETLLYQVDTTFLFLNTCDPNEEGEFIAFFPTDSCDRVELTVFDLVLADTTFLFLDDCDANLVGLDTLLLNNQNNCDSLVITETSLLPSDTIMIDVFSCDMAAVGLDTLFLSNQFLCDSVVIRSTNLSLSDTTFVLEMTCDITQLDTLVETFSTETCDSLVVTTFTLLEPDTTFLLEALCNEDRVADTFMMQNLQGCDSLIITNYENVESSVTLLEVNTCDVNNLNPIIDTLQGDFCDSVIITNFVLLQSDTIFQTLVVCNEDEVGIDTTLLLNVFGCDSLIISNNVIEEIEPTLLIRFLCDPEFLGLDTVVFASSNGCDSLVITDVVLAEADTTFVEDVFSCNQNEIGIDTLTLSTNTCDSVVIQVTQFVGLDTVRVEVASCDIVNASNDTINLFSAFACDSIVIVQNIPLFTSISIIDIPVMDPDLVKMDTTILANAVGCDSLLISNYFLEVEDNELDTVFFDFFTCDVNVEPDTTIGNDEVIINIPTQIIIDTTFLEIQNCGEMGIENDTLVLNSIFGCDSVVVNTFTSVFQTVTIIETITCNEDEIVPDTILLTSVLGCDSLIVTNYELIEIDTTFIEDTTCDQAQDLSEVIELISVDGCDSIVVVTYDLIVLDTTFIEDTTCDQTQDLSEIIELTSVLGCDSIVVVTYDLVEMDTVNTVMFACAIIAPDTIRIDDAECPTVEIISYEGLDSDTTFLSVENCTGPFGELFFNLVNAAGCDSVVVQLTSEAEQSITQLEESTCIENMPNDTLVLDGRFCDSLIITTFIHEPLLSTLVEVPVCDPEELFVDSLFFVNNLGCDSLVVLRAFLVDIDTMRLFDETCDPNLVGLDTTMVNTQDCPSLIIIETMLQGEPDTTRLIRTTCEDSLIGSVDVEDLININGCDSTVVISFVGENFDPSFNLFVEAPNCEGETNGIVNLEVQTGVQVLWLFDEQVTNTRGDLASGEYQIALSQNGCDTIINVVVPTASSIVLNFEVDYLLCSDFGGVIFPQIFGGQLPYTFNWQDGSMDSIRQNLVDGTYSVTVTDALGCAVVDSVDIVNVAGVTFSVSKDNVRCYEENNGRIEVEVLSGTAPLEVQWQDGNEDLIREDLEAGEYSCTISDANNCRVVINRIIFQPDDLLIDLKFNASDELEAVVTGGIPPFQYLWNDGTTSRTIEEPILGFGYEVTVTDANNCTAVRDEVFAQVSTSFIDFSKVSLFPNPNNGDFQFSFDPNLELENVIIYNIYGQEVEHRKYMIGNNVMVSIPNNTKGTFFINASFKQGRYIQKMLIF